jgi:hypothetical protein
MTNAEGNPKRDRRKTVTAILCHLNSSHSFELRHSDFGIPPVAIGGPDRVEYAD